MLLNLKIWLLLRLMELKSNIFHSKNFSSSRTDFSDVENGKKALFKCPRGIFRRVLISQSLRSRRLEIHTYSELNQIANGTLWLGVTQIDACEKILSFVKLNLPAKWLFARLLTRPSQSCSVILFGAAAGRFAIQFASSPTTHQPFPTGGAVTRRVSSRETKNFIYNVARPAQIWIGSL